MRNRGNRAGTPGPENDEEAARLMRWLRLAAEVVERGGGQDGKKGGEPVTDEDEPKGESAS